jgi:uncharacterized protein YecT (DUF1311 family)
MKNSNSILSKIIIVSVLAVQGFSNPVLAQDQQPNCTNPMTQTDMNICSGIAYEKADKKLNQVYKQLQSKSSKSEQAQLVKVQQIWIKFRDAVCNYEGMGYEGGTIQPLIIATCLEQYTIQRTNELSQDLNNMSR